MLSWYRQMSGAWQRGLEPGRRWKVESTLNPVAELPTCGWSTGKLRDQMTVGGAEAMRYWHQFIRFSRLPNWKGEWGERPTTSTRIGELPFHKKAQVRLLRVFCSTETYNENSMSADEMQNLLIQARTEATDPALKLCPINNPCNVAANDCRPTFHYTFASAGSPAVIVINDTDPGRKWDTF